MLLSLMSSFSKVVEVTVRTKFVWRRRKNGQKQHVSPWKGDIIIPESDIKTNNTRESYKKHKTR